MNQELLTTTEAGAYLKTPPKTLVAWRCTKRVKVPFVKIGGNIRYRKCDLDQFVESNLHDAQGGA